jgi:uncharacterized membrane protein
MLESLIQFLSTPAGIIALIGVFALAAIGLIGGGMAEIRFPDKFMRIAISLAVLSSSLYVVLSNSYNDETQKWAFGALGTILGAWLPRKD